MFIDFSAEFLGIPEKSILSTDCSLNKEGLTFWESCRFKFCQKLDIS